MFRKHWLGLALLAVFLATPLAARRPGDPLRPGFNFFSKEQDIQVGKEAADQVRQKMEVVQNPFLQEYINRVGKRLSALPEAGGYPFSFTLVNEKSINAFALPGGPMFVFSGLLQATDTEAQLAGVLAHELSHVALRHGTTQASKANLIQLPAMLASVVLGGNSMMGQLAQVGIGLGANSVLLKYSRDAESQADALGSHLMAEAGWNPVEMAHFFEKLESEPGSRVPQFLSDHPSPGNRVKAVEEEIQTLPRREYGYETGEFQRAKREVGQLPSAKPSNIRGGTGDPVAARPSGHYRQLQGRNFALSYPDNWQPMGDGNSDAATITSREGVVQDAQGNAQIGYGLIASHFFPDKAKTDLRSATQDLIGHLHSSNSSMQARGNPRSIRVDGNPALITQLTSTSPFKGGEETDVLVTVQRPESVFYIVFIAPSEEFRSVSGIFDEIVRSIRFSN